MTLVLSIRVSSRACGVFELASMRHPVLKPFDTVSNMVEAIPLGPYEFSPWKCVGVCVKASMQPVFGNIPCVFEKNVYPTVSSKEM